MNEDINKLKKKVEELEKKLSFFYGSELKGMLDDVQVERVFIADVTTGTPPTAGVTGAYADNNLLYQEALTGGVQDIKILNFPTKVMIYTWKGQRLAIPVYVADNIVYP